MFSTPYISSFTGGQVIIPVGARAFQIDCLSGIAYVGGALMLAGGSLSWAAPDEKVILGATLAAGTTGAVNRLNVFYTT